MCVLRNNDSTTGPAGKKTRHQASKVADTAGRQLMTSFGAKIKHSLPARGFCSHPEHAYQAPGVEDNLPQGAGVQRSASSRCVGATHQRHRAIVGQTRENRPTAWHRSVSV